MSSSQSPPSAGSDLAVAPGHSGEEHTIPVSLPPLSPTTDWDRDTHLASCLKHMQLQMAEMEKRMEQMSDHFFRSKTRPASNADAGRAPLTSWMEDDIFSGSGMPGSMFASRPGCMLRDARARWFSEDVVGLGERPGPGPSPTFPRRASHTEHHVGGGDVMTGFPTRPTPLTPYSSLSSLNNVDSLTESWGPVVVNHDGKQKMRYRFDVHQYRPEEITVKTLDNRLTIQAVHKEESEGNRVYQEYQRVYTLPDGVLPETLESSFNREGVLTIDAPLPSAIEAPKDTVIPIIHEKSA